VYSNNLETVQVITSISASKWWWANQAWVVWVLSAAGLPLFTH